MKALLVVAHGSRLDTSNDEVRELVEALVPRLGDRYQYVAAAFLELADPPVGAAIDAAVAAGCKEVAVLPYFLAGGSHVTRDIPALLRERRLAHPTVSIRLLDYIGRQPGMLELLDGAV